MPTATNVRIRLVPVALEEAEKALPDALPPAMEPLYDGEELRERRKELGLTLEELARSIGISPSWVSRVETGHVDLAQAPYALVRRYLWFLRLPEPKIR